MLSLTTPVRRRTRTRAGHATVIVAAVLAVTLAAPVAGCGSAHAISPPSAAQRSRKPPQPETGKWKPGPKRITHPDAERILDPSGTAEQIAYTLLAAERPSWKGGQFPLGLDYSATALTAAFRAGPGSYLELVGVGPSPQRPVGQDDPHNDPTWRNPTTVQRFAIRNHGAELELINLSDRDRFGRRWLRHSPRALLGSGELQDWLQQTLPVHVRFAVRPRNGTVDMSHLAGLFPQRAWGLGTWQTMTPYRAAPAELLGAKPGASPWPRLLPESVRLGPAQRAVIGERALRGQPVDPALLLGPVNLEQVYGARFEHVDLVDLSVRYAGRRGTFVAGLKQVTVPGDPEPHFHFVIVRDGQLGIYDEHGVYQDPLADGPAPPKLAFLSTDSPPRLPAPTLHSTADLPATGIWTWAQNPADAYQAATQLRPGETVEISQALLRSRRPGHPTLDLEVTRISRAIQPSPTPYRYAAGEQYGLDLTPEEFRTAMRQGAQADHGRNTFIRRIDTTGPGRKTRAPDGSAENWPRRPFRYYTPAGGWGPLESGHPARQGHGKVA